MTTTCPHCHKRLLSSASAKCNWCGQVVADAEFQARASSERDAFFAHQAERDTLSLSRTEAINPYPTSVGFDPLTGFPVHHRTSQTDLVRAEARAFAAAQEALVEEKREREEAAREKEEDAKPGARFRHLEL